MIPEFVGRLPVMVPMRSLTHDEILNVMTQPKNALVRQYKAMFALDDCELEFTDSKRSACSPKQAMKRETGVRSLRSMFEEVLLGPALRHRHPQGRDSSTIDRRVRAGKR